MLMVTYACNLNCSYCYEPYKKNIYMKSALAKEIILREVQFVKDSDDFDELEIDFMGGEPLMNFPLIKEIVEWLEGGVIDIPFICFATTNATLLTDEIKNWLREHKQIITLGASYDGTGKMQSINRGTDKHNIDLEFFKELWPNQGLHMTISKETLPTLAEGVLDMQEKGYNVEGELAEGIDWTIDDALMYREQFLILKDAYLKNPALTPIVLGDKALLADGVDWEAPESTADEYCKNCVLRSFCPTCPGFNYKYCGHIAVRDKCWCPVILAEAITSCEFQVERLAAIDKLDEEDAQRGQAALKAYKILKDFDITKSQSPYTI